MDIAVPAWKPSHNAFGAKLPLVVTKVKTSFEEDSVGAVPSVHKVNAGQVIV